MSYDLFFYKQKASNLSQDQIAEYLNNNLVQIKKGQNQWFFENPDTEVYYSFERNEPGNDSESVEVYESFPEFENTHFTFNLNFMRPCFFGLEAFLFVEQLLKDLDLFVLNPQSSSGTPRKETKSFFYENWNKTNLAASKDYFNEFQSSYISLEKSNAIWEYNYKRKGLQNDLKDDYFVPKVFFLKTKADNDVITLSTWTQHIPNVFPPADYFLLLREYKSFFRTVKDYILIDRATLLKEFGSYLDDFTHKDCKIIHPQNAKRVKGTFNSIKSKLKLEEFAERLPMENMYNAKSE